MDGYPKLLNNLIFNQYITIIFENSLYLQYVKLVHSIAV